MFPIHDEQPSGITPVVTYAIIALCSVVLVIEFLTPDIGTFFAKWALVPGYIDFSQIQTLYTFITSIFLHGGLIHFASNMWFLYIFGDNVEGELGHLKFLLFFLIGGAIAGFTQYLFLIGQLVPVIGASGAIAAVLGYYFIRFPHHRIETLVPSFFLFFRAKLPARFVLFFWFIIQLFSGTAGLADTSASSGVAWWAHIGGFVFGVLVAKLTQPKKPKHHEVLRDTVYPDEILYRR